MSLLEVIRPIIILGIFLIPPYLFAGDGGNILFLENKGQFEENVLFAADVKGGRVYITRNSLVFNVCELPETVKGHSQSLSELPLNCHSTRIKFTDSNEFLFIEKSKQVSTTFNFLTGGKHVGRVKAYKEITLYNVGKGLSIKFFSSGNDVKYDLILDNRVDIENFNIEYEGFDNIVKTPEGLKMQTSIGEWIEKIPEVYYIDESKETCPALISAELLGNRMHYKMQKPEKSQRLVIDPILIFSTYSGSTADNWGSTATYDQHGNLFSGGIVQLDLGGKFPITFGSYQQNFGGRWDVAITKYDSAGSKPIYSTYLGGNESEMVQSLVVNSKNQLVILGVTSSFNFPTHDQAFDRSFNGGSPIMPIAGVPMYNGSDIFVTVLSEDGSQLISSTFLGGNNSDGVTYTADKLVKNYGDESRGDIYVDEFDNIYVASRTNSTDFPVINAIQDKLRGAFDGVIVKLTSQLDQILWSTYFGGEDSDAALSIKTNSNGNIIVAGGTASPDLYPQFLNTYFGEIDGWVAVFSPDGSILESGRYVGTPGSDQSYFVDVDISDNVYLFGITDGEYPIQGNVFQEGSGQFIHKFSSDLSASILSTNFGNTSLGPDISPTAFLVNDCGNIYLSGWGGILNDYETNYFKGTTIGLPITLNAYQGVSTGNDFYLAVFLDDMQELLYATFLGGGINLTHVDGGTSRFDKKGIVYHAVCAGCAAGGYANSDFPTTNGAWSNQNNSSNCNNAAFKFDLSSLDARITTYDEEMKIENLTGFCIPDKTLFVNTSIGGVNFEWDFGDGRKVNTTSRDPILHEYKIPGKYKVTLRIIDTSTCAEEDDTFIYLDVFKYDFKSSEDALICEGETFILEASGANFYEWSLKDQTVVSNAASFSITPSESVEYYLRSTKGICEYLDTVFVEVLKKPTINVEIQRSCSDGMKVEIKSEIAGMTDYNWDMGEGTIISDSIFVFQYKEEGDYQIRLSVENEICLTQEIFPVKIRKRLIPSVFTPGIKDGKNDSFVMKGIENASLEVYNRWGRKVYENPDYDNSWTGEDLSAGTYFYYVIGENKEKCKGIVQIIK